MIELFLRVGARESPLSKKQVIEIWKELSEHHFEVVFQPCFVKTIGDRDQKTSLRALGKTDFFTREIDEMLLKGKCRIAVHSAKDLPEPLPEGLMLVALTKGVDPSDSLVLREGDTLRSGAVIATSSERREDAVKSLMGDVKFIDIRGSVDERLAKLHKGEVDGVVVAEAALIRLGLTDLNRIKLPGDTVPGQGQLAVVARQDDHEMKTLFSCINIDGPNGQLGQA